MVLPKPRVVGLFALLVLAAAACNSKVPPAPPATNASPADAPPTKRVVGPLTDADAAALATMNDKLKDYIALHTKLEATLPKLPASPTPIEIDKNQRQFEALMRKTRATAKQGDIFTPEAEPVIRRLVASAFAGPEGAALKKSIMDESPERKAAPLAVNARYPDDVPVSTVPPQILQTLPKLSEDLEYRFVYNDLIILDSHAHVVADFIPNVFTQVKG
jgi:hypothetical protein